MARHAATPDVAGRLPPVVWMVLVGFAFSVVSGHAYLIGLPLNLDRPLFLLAAMLVLLDGRFGRLRFRGSYVVWGVLVLWTVWSWMSTGSLTETAKAFALADRIVLPVAMLALGALAVATSASRLLVLRFGCLFGLYLGLTGIFEYAGLDALVFPRFVNDDSLGIGNGRGRGPFLASEPFGMACALILFMSFALLASRPSRRWQAVAVVTAVVTAGGVLVSLTRSVWLATVVGLLVVVLVEVRLRRRLPQILLAGVVAVGGTLLALPSLLLSVNERFSTQRSLQDRLNTNDAAWRIVDSFPLSGVGWGNFQSVSVDWVRQADVYPLTNVAIEVHNVFLSRAAELGIPGALLWVLVVVAGPVAAVWGTVEVSDEDRTWRLLALASAVVWLVPSLFSPNPYPMPNLLVWFLAGIAGRGWLVTVCARHEQPAEVAR